MTDPVKTCRGEGGGGGQREGGKGKKGGFVFKNGERGKVQST